MVIRVMPVAPMGLPPGLAPMVLLLCPACELEVCSAMPYLLVEPATIP